MCGLLGVYGGYNGREYREYLTKKENTFYRRGPDQVASIKKQCFFGTHSRLIVKGSVQDGVQPYEYKHISLLFNGNLYNQSAITQELKGLGYPISGMSDTEVVAKAIYHWGFDAFNKFNGFFAITVYDNIKNELTLARDKYGQKPIYYSVTSRAVYFGSTEEMIPEYHRGKVRYESYIDFLTYGFVPAPYTMYENMEIVEPAMHITFGMNKNIIKVVDKCKYWSPEITNEITRFSDAYDALSVELEASVYDGLKAHTNVACLLSGGIDSSLLFSYARDINKDLYTITADFGDEDDAKERALPLISAYNHCNYIIKNVKENDIIKSLDSLVDICGSPFDDTSVIPCKIVFSVANENGYKVVITGDGADELFCGYGSFSNLNNMRAILNPKLDLIRKGVNSIRRHIPNKYRTINFERSFLNKKDILVDLSCNGFKKREWVDGIDSDYDPLHHVETLMNDFLHLDVISQFRILNLTFKLPNQMLYKIDRTSMYNSVEARPIFLNDNIVNCALSINSKVMLKKGTKGLLKEICNKRLPTKEWAIPKTGFGWKTSNYKHLFNSTDSCFLYEKTGIEGEVLLKNREIKMKENVAILKRGYFGLHSLVTWIKAERL